MVVVYRCRRCGAVLTVYPSDERLRFFGIPTPEEVCWNMRMRCPKCGRKLEPDIEPHDVTIR